MPLDMKCQGLDGGVNGATSILLKIPSAIPLVSLMDFRSYVQRYLPVRGILIPFYEIGGRARYSTGDGTYTIH